jgi:prepilin peptidase CpaA
MARWPAPPETWPTQETCFVIGSFPTPVVVVLAASLSLGLIDLFHHKVYNILTYPLLIAGLVYRASAGGVGGLADGVLGGLLGLGVLLPFFVLGGTGGGDVKLMAALGAWLGVPLTLVVFLASCLAAGLCAVLVVLARGRVREAWDSVRVFWFRLRAVARYLAAEDRPDRRRVVPFAAVVACGLFGVLVWSRYLYRP